MERFNLPLILLILLTLAIVNVNAASIPEQDAAIDRAGDRLVRAEEPSPELLKFPREAVVKRVRVWLKNPKDQGRAARVALALHLDETENDFLKASGPESPYLVLSAADTLAKPEQHKAVETRFSEIYNLSLPVETRIALLEAMKATPLPKTTFEQSLQNKNPLFQRVVVSHFFRTRAALSSEERRERFQQIIAVDMIPLRALAITAADSMPANERAPLVALMNKKFCDDDFAADVKQTCFQSHQGANEMMKHISQFVSIVVTICLPLAAVADNYYMTRWAENYTHALDQTKNIGRDVVRCADAALPRQLENCRSTYKGLYAKSEVEFRFTFGYADSADLTGKSHVVQDYFSGAQFVEKLVRQPCAPSETICGFVPQRDGETFLKYVIGPDDQQKLVRVRVVTSSASPNDIANTRDPEQRNISARAETRFLDGLCNPPDVAGDFYIGHSRRCGGPSFEPPVRHPSTGLIDYDSYCDPQTGQQSYRKMLARLASCPDSHPKVLGLFSCNSEEHFGAGLRAVAPDIGTITVAGRGESGHIPNEEADERAMQTLESLMETRCEAKFSRAINPVGEEDPPLLIQNVFGGSSVVTPHRPAAVRATKRRRPVSED